MPPDRALAEFLYLWDACTRIWEPEMPESAYSWRSLPDITRILNVRQHFRLFFTVFRIKNNVTITFRDFLKSWAPDTYLYAQKDQNISYRLILEIQVPKSASENHHIGLSGRHIILETTWRANTTRLRVPDGSNQGFEPDNRPLDHFRGSGGSEHPLISCLTTAWHFIFCYSEEISYEMVVSLLQPLILQWNTREECF